MPNLTTLTHRETEIIRLIADGKRNSEIATSLHITINTVETHLRNIYSKLDIRTRTEATRWYWQRQRIQGTNELSITFTQIHSGFSENRA
jgi:DNA-binding CsgD family transcriptional regulator